MSQEEFQQRANTLGGPDTTVTNRIDDTAPSQAFTFVSSYQLGTGAHLPGDEFLIGCECIGKYSRDGGCQAPSTCECLHQAVGRGEENVKLFPYLGPNTQRPGCLIPFYLESRHPIFECNKRCTCGPKCKNRVVQQGRKVKLDIFKTHNRGWGESPCL
jgi:histone-lysine N-methyltransferase SUV39H